MVYCGGIACSGLPIPLRMTKTSNNQYYGVPREAAEIPSRANSVSDRNQEGGLES